MSDFGFYWKNFARESKRGDWPCKGWYSNDDSLAKRMTAGDRVWLFTSGDACGQSETKSAYLVEVLVVQKVGRNQGEDREYASGEFHYFIVAEPEKAFKIDPPLLVDDNLRPAGHSKDEHIGRLLQKPRRLAEEIVVRLQEQLMAERPDAAAGVLGE